MLALKLALDPIGDVTVVAPDTNQSAVGHQKTLMRPLRVRERTLGDGSLGYSLDGSPTDCVSLAFLGFFEERFDLVASGINYGANLGDDITYSGTVSRGDGGGDQQLPGVRGLPGVRTRRSTSRSRPWRAALVARNILEHGLKRGELVSVNVPAVSVEDCEGIEVTRVGRRVYQDELTERLDPRGIPYYWIGGPPPSGISVPGTDFNAVVNRRVSVTPIHLDLTGRRLLRQLQTWDWALDQAAHEAAHGADPGGGRGETTPSPVEQARIAEEASIERR